MAILNITYQGQSADYELALEFATSDADIRRIAIEVVRSGGAKGLYIPNLPTNAFASFVVDLLIRAFRRTGDPNGPGNAEGPTVARPSKCAREESNLHGPYGPLAPQASASTSSATSARGRQYRGPLRDLAGGGRAVFEVWLDSVRGGCSLTNMCSDQRAASPPRTGSLRPWT